VGDVALKRLRRTMFSLSPVHLTILLAIVLLVFGTKRLPTFGRNLRKSFREFKEEVSGRHSEQAASGDEINEPAAPGDSTADQALPRLPSDDVVAARQATPAPTPEIARAEKAARSGDLTE
jgi:sec-independent protein translocase protein TatA